MTRSLASLGILAEPSVPSEAHDTEYGLAKDAAVHLRGAQLAVDEDDGYLLDLESALIGGEFHLYLEGVAFEAYLVELNGLQHLAAVALEACGSILHLDTRHKLHVFGGVVRHQHTSHGPVHHIHATHIARADSHIKALIGTGIVEAGQVVGVVREVGIHLEDIVVLMLYGPLETTDIGGAKAELACIKWEIMLLKD